MKHEKKYPTRQVAKILGCVPGSLSQAVWNNKITPPPEKVGGSYVWTREDIIRAGWQLFKRDVRPLLGVGDHDNG